MFLAEKNRNPGMPFGELEHLIGWLGSKPARSRYCFTNGGRGLIERYFRDHKIGFRWVGERARVMTATGSEFDLGLEFYFVASETPRTYAAAVKRALTSLKKRAVCP